MKDFIRRHMMTLLVIAIPWGIFVAVNVIVNGGDILQAAEAAARRGR